MAHVRQQIRAAVVARLSGWPGFTASVQSSRVRPVDALPAAIVTTNGEASELAAMGGVYHREVDLEVTVFAKVNDTIDDLLDGLAVQIETAIASDDTFGGLTKKTVLDGAETEFSSDGETDAGSLTLKFTAVYMTAAADPETAI